MYNGLYPLHIRNYCTEYTSYSLFQVLQDRLHGEGSGLGNRKSSKLMSRRDVINSIKYYACCIASAKTLLSFLSLMFSASGLLLPSASDKRNGVTK